MTVKPPLGQSNIAGFTVRPAQSSDAAAIRQVARASWAAAYAGIIFPEVQDIFLTNAYSDQALARSIGGEVQDFWFRVVETTSDHPEIIGFAEVYRRPSIAPDAALTRIYLLPAWQKQGVGRVLFETVLEEIRALRPDLRPPRLWLSVATRNAQAIRFYERRGFRLEKDFEANLPGQTVPMREYVLEI